MYMLSNTIYGLCQVGVLKSSIIQVFSYENNAAAFLGNSNFFGSLSSLFYGITLGLFINLVCLIQITISIIKKRENRFVCLGSFIFGIISFVLVFSIYSTNHSTVKSDVNKMIDQAKSVVVDNNLNDDYGSGRMYIWKNAVEKLKDVPITGYGIDNFGHIFDNKLIRSGRVITKAHNDYLQKALCEGIISSLGFILLIIFFKGVFSKLSPIYYGLFLAFIGYSVQAFFNISFINVAPIYFIIIGLLISILTSKSRDDLMNKEGII